MESDDPEVAAMHLAYATTFDPFCVSALAAGAARKSRRLLPQPLMMPLSRPPLGGALTSDVYRKMPRTPLRGTAVGVLSRSSACPLPLLDRTLAYADRFPPTDDRSSCAALSQALDTADSGMVSDAAAALLPSIPPSRLLLPPARSTLPEEPADLQRAAAVVGDNADEGPRRTFMAPVVNPAWRGGASSRTALSWRVAPSLRSHKETPRAREEREKSGEPLRVRPLGVGSVLVRLASAHALGQVGADAREVMGPVQRSFQSGAGCETAYMSMRVALQLFGGRGTGGKGLLLLDIRNAFNEVSGVRYFTACFSTRGYMA
eukprot:jgi/Tetstr1/439525/TSEL_027954.t1